MYLGYQNNKIKFYTEQPLDEVAYNLDKTEYTEEEYALNADSTEYVLKNAEWEEEQAIKERHRLDGLTRTPADVEDVDVRFLRKPLCEDIGAEEEEGKEAFHHSTVLFSIGQPVMVDTTGIRT